MLTLGERCQNTRNLNLRRGRNASWSRHWLAQVQTDDKNKLFLKPRGVVRGVRFARTGSAYAVEIKMCTSLGGSELVPGGRMNSDHPNCKFVAAWEGFKLVPGGGMNSWERMSVCCNKYYLKVTFITCFSLISFQLSTFQICPVLILRPKEDRVLVFIFSFVFAGNECI